MAKSKEIVDFLKSSQVSVGLRSTLKKFLNGSSRMNYKSFGTTIEKPVIKYLQEALKYKFNSLKIKTAGNKNEFPDLSIVADKKIALDIKSGCKYNGKKIIKNSNNDLGTIRSWSEKIEKYEEILFLYIIYEREGEYVKDIKSVKISEFYEFIGINKDGLLCYRKKDGNLRPLNFEDFDKPKINSLKSFEELLEITNLYRSLDIISEHISNVKNIYDNVKSKIEFNNEKSLENILETCKKTCSKLQECITNRNQNTK